MSVNVLNFSQSSHTLQYLSPVLTVQVYIVQFNYCIVVCCLYVHKSYFIQEFIVYMRCIFPCLRLIYFYMGVEYIALFFLCFGKLRLEMLVLHCICPAETDRDRQSTNKDRRIQSITGLDSLSERKGSSCLKNRSSGFL